MRQPRLEGEVLGGAFALLPARAVLVCAKRVAVLGFPGAMSHRVRPNYLLAPPLAPACEPTGLGLLLLTRRWTTLLWTGRDPTPPSPRRAGTRNAMAASGPAARWRVRDGARWAVHALCAPGSYFREVKFRSQLVEYWLTTPRTAAASPGGIFSHREGIAGACSVTMSSILPQAFARSGPAGSTAAFDIASLMAGTSSCDQLELLACRMLLPLNTGSSRDCGSLKSLKKPTFGQITTWALGTLQNFV